MRDGDELDVVERRAAVVESLLDHGYDQLEMAPRRDLRHDAAELPVEVRLRRDDVRSDLAVSGDEGGGGLVAGRLDAEDHETDASGTASRHMITASSRLSV